MTPKSRKSQKWHAQYYQTHKEKIDVQNQRWVKEHPKEFRAIQKRYEKTEKGKLTGIKKQKNYQGTLKDKIRIRKAHLKATYGITLEQYNNLFDKQNGVCAICKKPEWKSGNFGLLRLGIDHNHKTGKIRGLLCHRCNSILGYADDSIELLLNCIKYITPS